MVYRGELSNEQWEKIEPLLPPQKPWTGRPSHEHRTLLNGILWILRTGSPWRDLPERYGKWTTVYSRFQRWRKKEVWQRVLSELQSLADQQGQLDWGVQFEDGTIVRAHQHAAGAKKAHPKRKP
jgi:transposase